MEMEWVETFLTPFVLVYSTLTLYIIDVALIESRFSKRVYYGISTVGNALSCVLPVVLYSMGGLPLMQRYGIFVTMLPSCALFYFLSKHRGSRLFLAFCTADIAGIAMMLLSLCTSVFFGDNQLAILLGLSLLSTLDKGYGDALISNGFVQGDIGNYNAYLNKGGALVRDIIMFTDKSDIEAAQAELEETKD